MSTFMIKVTGEGAVAPAHQNADPGPTSGSSTIYEVINVPAGIGADEVVTKVRAIYKAVPHNDLYEVDYGALGA